MKPLANPQPLTPSQIRHVLELLDMRLLAPQETAATFNRLSQAGTFSEAQQEAIELLFALDEDEIGDALMDFADDEARDIVRDNVVHEARMSFVGA
ncbi:hypothetical protein [Variovorax arabinosiphilus]|uniref:hypothetical protein n=1 Tax=Variovorax arabinosiphilus TaxID=3053498 RepID=UPI002578F6D7|nr:MULTISPECIES: hypothetical protein [unclassified Variovorax]MDM0120633.1 hypothetical protein [Variovorax sp. J2L1-78]MDM0127455.1 hypothetical protein [Variovorax sp. J2L1-63]MDM0231154.1 hypothetical protein [Variovorax sp. J2R1-6]